MPEIKHVFTGGKMNKDLDERFVPNGQYRDAMNIQVRSAEGGASGTVQNIQGNAEVVYQDNHDHTGSQPNSVCVGYCGDEAKNKSYWFIAGPDIEGLGPDSWGIPTGILFNVWRDFIMEYNGDTDVNKAVFVDHYANTCPSSKLTLPTGNYSTITMGAGLTAYFRPGCYVQAWTAGNVPLYSTPPKVIAVIGNTIALDKQYSTDVSTAANWAFWWDPVLQFDQGVRINAANIIDDFLFITDGVTEPKKINIPRSEAGTSGTQNHTKLMVENANGQLVPISSLEPETDDGVLREHVTVLRPAPKCAPRLEMSNTTRGGVIEGTIPNQSFSTSGVAIGFGEEVSNVVVEPASIDLVAGDYVILTNEQDEFGEKKEIRALVLDKSNVSIDLSIQSTPDNLLDTDIIWRIELEQKKPLFELEFGRFAYRYKYVDGEYSAFSPFSEVAFLPDEFEYEFDKGHNLGMINSVRQLKVTNFVADDEIRPDDVDEIDILYKKTTSPNVYVVKTIKRDIDPEWDVQNADNQGGEIHITSEMIHRTLPSNQIMRPWDAVPRTAFAQEIVGNRLVYGNYLQNYDVPRVALDQLLFSESVPPAGIGQRSVKSLRKYRIGVVYGDKLGRETPVQELAVKTSYDPKTGDYNFVPSDLNVSKTQSEFKNSIIVSQDWTNVFGTSQAVPDWMSYCKYYVKETSNEYYTLVMDRWYEAEDGNVWISFPSSERNKVDEETYIILKNEHGNEVAVNEEARYKILAISNSVPDFVAHTGYIYGSSEPDDAWLDVPDEQWPNQTQVVFETDVWTETIGSFPPDVGDQRLLRLSATDGNNTHKSAWVKITNISIGDNTSGGVQGLTTVTLAEPLGPGADFTVPWNANNYGTTPGITAEFKVTKKEALPEYDGRFFAKIHRDGILDRYVLHEQNEEGAFWSTLSSFSFSYLALGKASANWNNDTDKMENPAFDNPVYAGDYNTYATFAGGVNNGIEPGSNAAVQSWNVDVLQQMDWDDDSEDNGHVNKIGYCGSQSKTKDFWEAWGDNQTGAGFWFLDSTRFVNDSDWNESYWQLDTNSGAPNAGRGLYASGGVGSQHDVMFFSARSTSNGLSDAQSAFKNNIKQIGAYFRFTNDPNQEVYRVIANSGTHTVRNYHNGGCSNNANNDCTLSWTSCPRTVFWVKFRRVNKATATLINGGVMIDQWDPRGEIRHTGFGSQGIEIVTPIKQGGGKIIHNQSSGIWETEPKESVDLDIYYESSNAIPMTLDQYNIYEFAPIGSRVNSYKRTTGYPPSPTVIQTGTTSWYAGNPGCIVRDLIYGAVDFRAAGSINPASPNGEPFNFFVKGDEVTFTHHDGVETMGVIKDYVYQYNANTTPTPIPTDSITFNAGIPPGQTNTVMQLTGVTQANINLLQAMHNQGWRIEVTGDGVLPGTFIATSIPQAQVLPDGSFTYVSDLLAEPQQIDLTQALNLSQSNAIAIQSFTFTGVSGLYTLEEDVHENPVKLAWHNCYSFGNGVESDRIRDDFNAPQLDNGAKASTVIDDYGEELRSSGLIYSGIYNSNSGVNNLNEFNMSEKITKDLNPGYGSIQALKTRDTNVLAFCEDKVLKILANKDALFNADGNPQLTASDRVLGQAVPFAGDYGISKNPESLASDQYRLYFTDKQRGAVLRLSNDGLTPISNVGMKDWFRENLALANFALGTFDVVKGEYNLTLKADEKSAHQLTPTTITFNEESKGWISFKSFIPDAGGSISGKYLTSSPRASGGDNVGRIWRHYVSAGFRNYFYGAYQNSYVTVLFNDNPSDVKTFLTFNYEGTNAKIPQYTQSNVTDAAGNTLNNLSDGEYYNLTAATGWWADNISTDLADTIAQLAIDKKADKVIGVNLKGLTSIADHFIICFHDDNSFIFLVNS